MPLSIKGLVGLVLEMLLQETQRFLLVSVPDNAVELDEFLISQGQDYRCLNPQSPPLLSFAGEVSRPGGRLRSPTPERLPVCHASHTRDNVIVTSIGGIGGISDPGQQSSRLGPLFDPADHNLPWIDQHALPF